MMFGHDQRLFLVILRLLLSSAFGGTSNAYICLVGAVEHEAILARPVPPHNLCDFGDRQIRQSGQETLSNRLLATRF